MASFISKLFGQAAPQPMSQPQGQANPVGAVLAHAKLPVFTAEGPDLYQQAFARNRQFAHPGPYNTQLSPSDEKLFQQWVKERKVPFDPNAKISDYDMRGFWKENPGAAEKWQRGHHFPDTYKTPYDTTFSAESKYALPHTPFVWVGDKLIDKRTGEVVFANAS